MRKSILFSPSKLSEIRSSACSSPTAGRAAMTGSLDVVAFEESARQ
jgi:hypothetical protein